VVDLHQLLAIKQMPRRPRPTSRKKPHHQSRSSGSTYCELSRSRFTTQSDLDINDSEGEPGDSEGSSGQVHGGGLAITRKYSGTTQSSDEEGGEEGGKNDVNLEPDAPRLSQWLDDDDWSDASGDFSGKGEDVDVEFPVADLSSTNLVRRGAFSPLNTQLSPTRRQPSDTVCGNTMS
jgi:hypothetical protein